MISATGTSNAGPGTLLGHTREFRSRAGVAKRAPCAAVLAVGTGEALTLHHVRHQECRG